VYDHPGALGELGRLHTLGHGRELNYNTALKYLERGVELMDSNSLVTIGIYMYIYIYIYIEVSRARGRANE
jgi:TPR repeat protein